MGHGFYLEDGSENYNVLDRNLAVQAFAGKPLPGQFLQFDRNDGAGFWWANSLNSFTRNVAVECDRYGYRYEATPREWPALVRPVLRADGRRDEVDIRTLPFVRFEGNEAHSQLYGINLGEGVGGVGPDPAHPFLVREIENLGRILGFPACAHLGGRRWDGRLQRALRHFPSGLRPAHRAVRPGDIQGCAPERILAIRSDRRAW